MLEGRLPDWSDAATAPDAYEGMVPVALEFLALDALDREIAVRSFADAHCLPRFDLGPASGLYLFLRVAFDLPSRVPREEVKVFGGWLHPSIGGEGEHFDLSWPVRAPSADLLAVDPFPGYFGKGYDAAGEHRWFEDTFPLRGAEALASVRIVPPP